MNTFIGGSKSIGTLTPKIKKMLACKQKGGCFL